MNTPRIDPTTRPRIVLDVGWGDKNPVITSGDLIDHMTQLGDVPVNLPLPDDADNTIKGDKE